LKEAAVPWAYIVLFSFIQGATEFLPVSSSAHLLVLPHILGGADQGVVVDIAAHAGSFLAVLLVFRKEVWSMASALFTWKESPARELALKIGFATVPVALGASTVFFLDVNLFRNPIVPILTLAVFGVFLWWADARFHGDKGVEKLSFRDAFLIGCGQALAIVPGVSRSGICLTMGIGCGLERAAAVKFAFLLSIPSIMLVPAGVVAEYIKEPEAMADAGQMLAVVGLSFLFSLGAMRLMLAWVSMFSFKAFAIYRIAFAALLAFFLSR
jgi:undecaprenyl-diphosphatase